MKTTSKKNPIRKLINEITFLDLETTGTNINESRIVEICLIKGSKKLHTLIDPETPIPPECTAVHGITDEMVGGKPKLNHLLSDIHLYIHEAIISGFNSDRFDIPLLAAELDRSGYIWDLTKIKTIDVMKLHRVLNPGTLSDVYKSYTGDEHEGAHGAYSDTVATKTILEYMFTINNIPGSAEELEFMSNGNKKRLDIAGCFSYNENDEIVLTFGKHKGMLAKNCLSYLSWMLTAGFNNDTKQIATQILNNSL